MCAAVETQFPSLAEGFSTSIHTANEWLLVRMCILMFTKVLRESKHFAAILTRECLLSTVNIVVALERELGSESFAAVRVLTNEYTNCAGRRILGNIFIQALAVIFIN